MTFRPRAAAITLTLAPVLAAVALAGPLTPPPGPVAPTKGPEPRTPVNAANTPGVGGDQFRINQPGSYYLESNISIAPGRFWGIGITAPGVTLDLNGFTIDGNSLGSNGGIIVGAPGVIIRNGTIRNVSINGIGTDLFPTGSPGVTVENVRVLDVSGGGIPPGGVIGSGSSGIFGGRGAIIRNCYVNNAAIGITAGYNANISGCTIESTRQFGINIEGGANVSDCVVVGVGGGPADGHAFVLGLGSSVDNCVARSNSGAGFVDSGETAFTNCRSSNNTGAGFVVANFTRLDGCHGVSNTGPAVSIVDARDWEITRCTFSNNAGGGIMLSGQALRGRVHDCNVRGMSTLQANSIGVQVPTNSADIVITGSTFAFLYRGVILEGTYCRVTNNAFNLVGGSVLRADGSNPGATNFIGTIVPASQAGTATSPFANTAQ